MGCFPKKMDILIAELSKLPGIGPKSAQRLAFYLLERKDKGASALAEAISNATNNITFCPQCFHLAEGGLCSICSSTSRDTGVICIVETSRDIPPIENSGSYNGLYHVLGGLLSPMDGIGPDEIHIRELKERISNNNIREIILATGSTSEGEATASYIGEIFRNSPLKVTRIAQGMPVGGDLEYIDEITLARALAGRREI